MVEAKRHLFMYNDSDMRNALNISPIFKISRTYAWKMTPLSWFREFAPPIQKIPPFCENGYERGMRFGREWEGGMGGGRGEWEGGRGVGSNDSRWRLCTTVNLVIIGLGNGF